MLKLTIVDLLGLAVPIFKKSEGQPPHFIRASLEERIRKEATECEALVIACDSRVSWRRDKCPNYKEHREKRPEYFWQSVRDALTSLSKDFVCLEAEGFEADDVIASVVNWVIGQPDDAIAPVVNWAIGRPDGFETTILTQDKDLCALVSDMHRVSIWHSMLNTRIKEADVKAKFGGIGPDRVRDFLSLTGDTSDNVPGCPGVGVTWAAKLLLKHGSLAEVLRVCQDTSVPLVDTGCTEKLRAKIVEHSPDIVQSWDMCQLCGGLISEGTIVLPETFPHIHKSESHIAEAAQEFPCAPAAGESITHTQEVPPMSMPLDAHVEQARASGQLPTAPAAAPSPAPVAVATTDEFTRLMSRPARSFQMALEPETLKETFQLSQVLFASHMFDGSRVPNQEAIQAIIMMGRSLGLGAVASLMNIKIVEGKPTISADGLVAVCISSPLCEYFEVVESTLERATWRCKRVGRQEERRTFTIEDAARAGLIDKPGKGGGPGVWKTYPARMLLARAKAYLARDVFPDICAGIYTTEEME